MGYDNHLLNLVSIEDESALLERAPPIKSGYLRLKKRWSNLFPLGVLGPIDRPQGLFPGMEWAGALEGNAPAEIPTPTIYTTVWCSDCLALKAFFKRKGIPWETNDIDGNEEGISTVETLSMGRRVIPTLDYGTFSLCNPPLRVFAALYG
ncbi:glutaredoxin family protein [bacterium]|nr:glutaredoxin family protein [bacterium]